MPLARFARRGISARSLDDEDCRGHGICVREHSGNFIGASRDKMIPGDLEKVGITTLPYLPGGGQSAICLNGNWRAGFLNGN